MSRQETFAWASILSTSALLLCYIVFVFGIPTILDPTGNKRVSIILTLFGIAVLLDLGIELFKWLGGRRVESDERDDKIKSTAIKNAYWVLLVAVLILTGQIFIQNLMGEAIEFEYMLRMQTIILHFLILVLFAGQLSKYLTQVILYRREA